MTGYYNSLSAQQTYSIADAPIYCGRVCSVIDSGIQVALLAAFILAAFLLRKMPKNAKTAHQRAGSILTILGGSLCIGFIAFWHYTQKPILRSYKDRLDSGDVGIVFDESLSTLLDADSWKYPVGLSFVLMAMGILLYSHSIKRCIEWIRNGHSQ
jgi:hypothetical protein